MAYFRRTGRNRVHADAMLCQWLPGSRLRIGRGEIQKSPVIWKWTSHHNRTGGKNDFLGKIEQVLETAIGLELIATPGLPRDSISDLG